MRSRLLVLCACCLVFSLYAQSPATSAQNFPLRVTTRLVQVDVVVRDKKGQPITDLKQEDFEVTDQGKPQKISVFAIESNQKAIGRAGPLPPNTFSNLPSRQGASQNLTVILFDTLNTGVIDQVNAKREVLRFLQQIQPQDRVAIYGLGAQLRVVHDFTGSAEALARAIGYYKARLSPEHVSSLPPVEDNTAGLSGPELAIIQAMDAFLNASNQLVGNYYIERRMAITLQALGAISSHIAALPGRKGLVWISGGFPFTYGNEHFQVNQANVGVKNFADDLKRTAQAITNANVAIYPVDARAFMSASTVNPSSSAETGGRPARRPSLADTQVADDVLASHSTMQDLADKTGGRASWGTGDVEGAIRRTIDDSRLTYALGYYPSDIKLDGKFRTIKVSVKRPGVQLRYRHGYYALPDEPMDEAHRQDAINTAARSPLDATGVGFVAKFSTPGESASMRQIDIDVDTSSLALEQKQDTWSGGLDVVFAQLDGVGNVVGSIGRLVPIRLNAAERERLLSDGLVLNAPLEIQPKCAQVRIIIRDAKSGAIGTVTAPLK
ncbi:MAG: VWA domain-containing protein [Acidobacteria bacterium]|nr:VWA domain-containing protein [Acidobacteriota bacterium]